MLAEWLRPSQRTLNRALHAAAGIIIAVIAVEVMPEALEGASAQPLRAWTIPPIRFGMLNPLLAAFIHVSSELAFILNSARLLPAATRC